MFKLKDGWTKRKVMNRIKKYNNGKKAFINEGKVTEQCAYETKGGNRCAIGCFIPDGHKGLKNLGNVVDLIDSYPDLKDFLPFDDILALERFQVMHDESSEKGVHKSIKYFLETEVE